MSGLSRRAAVLPLGAAVLLVVLSTPLLDDDGWRGVVLPGAALLLGLAVAAAVDEPDAVLLAASPTTFRERVGQRLLGLAVVGVPAALAVSAWTVLAGGSVGWADARALVGFAVGALALSAALRRWAGLAEPTVVAGPLLLVGLLLGRWLLPHLPDVGLTAAQGWAVGTAAGLGVLALALRDPATASAVAPRLRAGGPAGGR